MFRDAAHSRPRTHLAESSLLTKTVREPHTRRMTNLESRTHRRTFHKSVGEDRHGKRVGVGALEVGDDVEVGPLADEVSRGSGVASVHAELRAQS